jgi:hypothetical protein
MIRNISTRVAVVITFLVVILSARAQAGHILWDDSHDSDGDELSGNFSAFAATISSAGHTLTELNGVPGAITPAALNGVNAFFLFDAEQALTSSEVTTLQNFVAAGGGLFVAWDAGTNLASNNALLAPYGISINGTTASSASVTGFLSHPVTTGVSTIQTSFGTILAVTGSAIDLTVAGGTSDILAVSAAPYRVVVLGDTGTFNNAGQGSTGIANVDNAKLAINIANFTSAPEPTSILLLLSLTAPIACMRRRAWKTGPN